VIHHQLGELSQAEPLYNKAMKLLKKTEDGRYYAGVLNSYAILLRAKGRYDEAANLFKNAIHYFSESAVFDDLGYATNNLAYTYIRLGHYEAATDLLEESLELRRRATDIAGESMTLELMGVLHLEQGRLDEARQSLNSAIQLAELAKNDQERAFALITLGRVLAAQGALDESKEKLDDALRLAIQLKSKMLESESCAYLAEVYARKGDGVVAYEHLHRARNLLNGYTDAYLKTQIERIENLLKEEKIKMAGGTFVIKSSFLPTWREAHESLGKFLLMEALQRAQGSQVRASELLGVTKAYITMLRRKYDV
jgi:tetratricopeptide (TPR) repeat protein